MSFAATAKRHGCLQPRGGKLSMTKSRVEIFHQRARCVIRLDVVRHRVGDEELAAGRFFINWRMRVEHQHHIASGIDHIHAPRVADGAVLRTPQLDRLVRLEQADQPVKALCSVSSLFPDWTKFCSPISSPT